MADSPNDWGDTDIFLLSNHRSFNIEKENFSAVNMNLKAAILKKDYFIFEIAVYIHSGVNLYFDTRGGFDYSKAYILISKIMDFDLQRNSIEELKNKDDEEIAQYYAKNLIKTWNVYLNNNVYSVQIVKEIKCECCDKVKDSETLEYLGSNYIEEEKQEEELISIINDVLSKENQINKLEKI